MIEEAFWCHYRHMSPAHSIVWGNTINDSINKNKSVVFLYNPHYCYLKTFFSGTFLTSRCPFSSSGAAADRTAASEDGDG